SSLDRSLSHPYMTLPPHPPLSLPPFFFFNDTATTEIYTLSLHDALPISLGSILSRANQSRLSDVQQRSGYDSAATVLLQQERPRSEEHTSELQSLTNLVCRLLLEKKKRAVKSKSA